MQAAMAKLTMQTTPRIVSKEGSNKRVVEMFGVVLWSDPSDRKAVFWCEDQGDLAYYECPAVDDAGYTFFDAGDMVRFDVTMDQKLRRAHNPSLVQEHACVGLPDRLRLDAAQESEPAPSDKIIPFTPGPRVGTPSHQARRKA